MFQDSVICEVHFCKHGYPFEDGNEVVGDESDEAMMGKDICFGLWRVGKMMSD
jgi:hypothetical protein